MKKRVSLRNPQQDRWDFQLRIKILAGIIFVLFLLLLIRLFWLQVISYSYYHTLAEANRISIVPVVPHRGNIFDRNGLTLANNTPTYTLEINPRESAPVDQVIEQLSHIITISSSDKKLFHKLNEESRGLAPVAIRARLSEEEIARFSVYRYAFKGVSIESRLIRNYPLAEATSHVVGYISRINQNDLDHLDDEDKLDAYRGTNHIGKLGIEAHYESLLHGVTGSEQVETDSSGHGVRTLSYSPPVAGTDLFLTIDATLQVAAEKAFGEHRGALVAIDPSTGEILAFVSQPGFDPNLFVDGIDQEHWNDLNNSPNRPLNDRALRGQYPPGSTIKPLMALLALNSGVRSAQTLISDPGYFALPGSTHHYRDWRVQGHGMVDMHLSIVQSCDTYYYSLANQLGIDRMHDFFSNLGFGKKSGIDLDGELTGLYPSTQWKRKRYHQDWYTGETIISGIGQGYILVTPLQLASAIATFANHGVMMRPHLLKSTRNPQTNILTPIPLQVVTKIPMADDSYNLIRDAMVDVMKPGGTAATAGAGAKYLIAGKTGTAQVIGVKQGQRYNAGQTSEFHRDHALFVAFAPADKPKIAIAVLVENGGHGGSTAAPIARQVMDNYLLGLPTSAVKDNQTSTQPTEEEAPHD
ncbi:MAG: penicillin-binding protein 2 [Ferrovum sp. 37-45-19]|uniref:penicillin-binding protein 2 n=1 Tax=Ferrovum sp. JA12 TaxID=1356299 RepID=UPI0007032FBE|nr:penicillin-binding protein 2 [Ferrovum sp. JA12]OYV80529.1 MAG: penicillin-binding protein 2 [Ferrovum sp. 21-44-67]OYV94844.1 MAG: penicillin-binding protein 2 [Ferrovum sp. 37-45-19]HQT81023.1 penicillin-binding protein 2 [Ferrovaceae bacterium]KRH79252.1 stage V sporulation protein D [Ferrovum sp. JA12]HQU06160.1 penicillin-binding protein 2 [Ferrovaceae bacterium]